MNQPLRAKLADATRSILHCENDFYEMKHAADRMYEVFTAISGITAAETAGEIILPSGKAIAPGAAAHCLLEFRRTAVFLRGIYKAIDKVAAGSPSRPIRIFYAGCGPYATLTSPLFTVFTPDQLQVDFLDINETSLTSAQKVIVSLGLEKSVGSYTLEDAATYTLPEECDYDIIISETMQSCLANEPQVAIMQNLIPQMRTDAIFIPEIISLDAFMTDPKQEMDKYLYSETPKAPPERIPLGNILKVDKDSLATEEMGAELTIPETLSTCVDLQLFTTVTVFDDEVLNENDASITLPQKYYEFKERYAEKVRFWYDCSNIPKIDCAIIAPG